MPSKSQPIFPSEQKILAARPSRPHASLSRHVHSISLQLQLIFELKL